MVFEHIEKLKHEYTDKYVVVDESRPELRRFDGQTGLVRTVNMNGRALVEFDAFENIGWYDIDIDFLKIIDKPLPKPEPKAAPAKKPAPKTTADKQAEPKKAGGGMSVEEMLAAARGEKSGGAPAAKPKPAAKPESKQATKATGGAAGMSVEEMLAAARAETTTPTGAATEVEQPPEATPEPEPVAEKDAEKGGASGAITPRDQLPTDTAVIIEFCRRVDGE